MKPQRAQRIERLVDADPRFLDWSPDRAINPHLADKPDRCGVLVLFECPIHDDCHVSVQFRNALDGGGPLQPEGPSWERTGDTAETLTLSPSIRVLGGPNGCEWHGFIRAGRFEHCGDSK